MKQEQAHAPETPRVKRWLTPKQAAARYGFGISTLAKYRIQGGGCKFAKIYSKVLYAEDDFDAWLESRRVNSTSQSQA